MSTMQTVWVLLAAALILAWLFLVVLGPRKVESTGAVLRYGSAWRTVGLVLAMAPAMVMMYLLGAFPWGQSEVRMNIAGLSFFAVSIIAGLPLIEMTRLQLVVTEQGLTRYSPWSATVLLEWIEIERVGYSALNRWFIVDGAGRTIRVSRHLAGIGAFVAAVRRHVAPERCASAATVLDAVK